MSKTVGIVGAGVSGLVAIKICMEEGLQPTAYEKSSTIGGMWNYDEDTSPTSSGRLYKSLVLNTCRVMGCFSDFPMSPESPPFPSHEQYLRYHQDYADHFKLRDHIQLNTEVVKIEKAKDYDVMGRWTIHTRQEGKEIVKQTFDFIMICSGYFTNPVKPPYPGLHEFTGSVSHSAHYRTNEPFADKNVLVLGESLSGCDIVTDVSFSAKQVYMSFWLFKRSGLKGYPFDCYLLNRFNISFLPTWLQKYLYEGFFEMDTNYDAMGIRPNRPKFRVHFGISDFLSGQFMNGRVKTKPAVKRFFQNGVEFVDGTKLNDLDAVIFATGFTVTTPFIDDDLVPDDLETRDLYKYVFPVRLPHATLACIGLVSFDSSVPSAVEIQSRWSVRVFKGTITLPPRNEMQEDITRKLQKHTEIFGKLRHFELIIKSLPSSGARKAVMNCWEDSLAGLSGKVVKKNDSYIRWLLVLGLFIIILAILY